MKKPTVFSLSHTKPILARTLLAATILTASSAALAAGPRYNYLQGQWQESELEDSRAEFDGIGVAASFELNQQFFAFGQFSSLDDRGVDLDRWAIGAAYKMPFGTNTDLNFGAGIVDYEINTGPFSDDDSGLMLTAGIRSMLDKQLEVGASASYEDAYDIDMLLNVYGAWHFTPQLAAGLTLTEGDLETTAVFVRYSF